MTNARELANLVGGTLTNLTSGTDNVALGDEALEAVTSGANNVGIGKDAGTAITTSNNNTVVGFQAGYNNTTGASNTLSGTYSGYNITTGSNNTSLGYGALSSAGSTANTASSNTAVGYQAAANITTGTENVALGHTTLASNTTGSSNTAIGRAALFANTTASNNTAVGYQAGVANTTAADLTAIGFKAGTANTTGAFNTFVGKDAGLVNTTGTLQTFIGEYSGRSTTGSNNTFLGQQSGQAITSGTKNTIIGRYTGNGSGVDIRTLSSFIVLSDGDGFPRAYWDNTGRMAVSQAPTAQMAAFDNTNTSYGSVGVASNVTRTSSGGNYFFFSARDTNAGAYRFYVEDGGSIKNSTGSYAAISDEKLKENIEDSGSQWDDIKAIRVRKFSMKEFNKDKPDMIGVIAQEVEAAGMTGLVDNDMDRDDDGLALETSTKTVKYSILYMKAIKALQEAMTRIETLETEVAALKG